jgi:hypothetical protein
MLELSRRVLETPQKGSSAELTRANEAMRKCLDGKLEIQTAVGSGTSILLTVPILS